MKVPYVPEGLEAIIFTADGDMRQALNNLQATYSGFRFVNQENVFKVKTQNYCHYFGIYNQYVVSNAQYVGCFSGLRPASSIACEEYGASCARG